MERLDLAHDVFKAGMRGEVVALLACGKLSRAGKFGEVFRGHDAGLF
jgi:hypothetical protein